MIENDPPEGEEQEEKASEPKPITYAKMKSFASVEETLNIEEEPEEFIEMIESCTLEIVVRHSQEHNSLSGSLENIRGIKEYDSKKVNCVRFHITLLPSRKRVRTGYRSLRELNCNIAFAIRNVTIENLKGAILRFRLYGRRMEFGVPVNNEKCLGESHLGLDKYMETLECSGDIRSKQAILPKSQQFPSTEESNLPDGL